MRPPGGTRQGALAGAVAALCAVVAIVCAHRAGTAAGADADSAAAWTAGAQHRLAVPPPGRFDGPLAGDDLLVTSAEPLSDRVLRRILAVRVDGRRAVTAAEEFSLGQFAAEDRVLTIAAVDAAGFRRFTGPDATDQRLWDRVARGDVAVAAGRSPGLTVHHGSLPVGSGREVREIPVGAHARYRVGAIDALVNERWGRALGMPAGNALLVSTGLASPQAVRDEIRSFAPGLSIVSLDIVAQAGIDPGATQTVGVVGTFSDAVGAYRYTPVGGGRIAPDPSWVRSHIVTEAVPILGRVTCNRFMMPQLAAALREVQASGLSGEIHVDEYAGCYNPRFIAGTTTLSNHAFGLALDLNVPGNQRGTVGQMNRAVVAIFKRWGFAWGGDWRDTDPMHFELERIVGAAG